jgi:hypothetical protein
MILKQNLDATGPKYWQPAALSFLAYCDNPDQLSGGEGSPLNIQVFVARWFPAYQVVWSSTLTANDNYGFIAVSPDNEYFLTFRGTLPFQDGDENAFLNWAEDLNVLSQQDWSSYGGAGARISAGAYQAFEQMDEATNMIGSDSLGAYQVLAEQAVQYSYPVYISGHSLGGNIANTFASYFASQLVSDGYTSSTNVTNHYLCTFAAPAPGNKAFAYDLAIKFPTTTPCQGFHYEGDNDVIPRFPMRHGLCDVISTWYPAPYAEAAQVQVTASETLAQFLIGLGNSIYKTVTLNGYQPKNAYVQSVAIAVPMWLSDYPGNTLTAWVEQAASQHAAGNYFLMFWWITPPEAAELAAHMTKATTMLPSAQMMARNTTTAPPTLS